MGVYHEEARRRAAAAGRIAQRDEAGSSSEPLLPPITNIKAQDEAPAVTPTIEGRGRLDDDEVVSTPTDRPYQGTTWEAWEAAVGTRSEHPSTVCTWHNEARTQLGLLDSISEKFRAFAREKQPVWHHCAVPKAHPTTGSRSKTLPRP